MDISQKKTFLILEDDANDAILIRRAFSKGDCRVFVCRNTSEARAYFSGAGMYADRERFPFPDMLLTDMRLGEESGGHFIEWLRRVPELRDLPVIVLSGVASPDEVRAVRRLGVKRVLRKPAETNTLQTMLMELSEELCRPEGEWNRADDFETDFQNAEIAEMGAGR